MDKLRKEMIDAFNKHPITEYIEKNKSNNGMENVQFTSLGQELIKNHPDAIQMFFMSEDLAVDVMMDMERDKAVELLKYFHNHPSEHQEQELIYQAYGLNPDVREFASQYDKTYLRWVVRDCDYENKDITPLFEKYPLKSLNVDYETSLSILKNLYVDTLNKIKPQIQDSLDMWVENNYKKAQSESLTKNDIIHIDFILKKSQEFGLQTPALENIIGERDEHDTKKTMENMSHILNAFTKKYKPAIVCDGIKDIDSFEIKKVTTNGKLQHFEINAKGKDVDITIKCKPEHFQRLNDCGSVRVIDAIIDELSKKSDGVILEQDLQQVNIQSNYSVLTADERNEINLSVGNRQDKSEFIKDAIEKINGMEDQIIDR